MAGWMDGPMSVNSVTATQSFILCSLLNLLKYAKPPNGDNNRDREWEYRRRNGDLYLNRGLDLDRDCENRLLDRDCDKNRYRLENDGERDL